IATGISPYARMCGECLGSRVSIRTVWRIRPTAQPAGPHSCVETRTRSARLRSRGAWGKPLLTLRIARSGRRGRRFKSCHPDFHCFEARIPESRTMPHEFEESKQRLMKAVGEVQRLNDEASAV